MAAGYNRARIHERREWTDYPPSDEDSGDEGIPDYVYTPGPDSEDVLRNGKLWKEAVFTEGVGDFMPEVGMIAEINYKGQVLEMGGQGAIFEDSQDYGQTIQFVIGGKGVIEALGHAVLTMKKGEKAIFIAAHELAFGSSTIHGIPSKSTVTLDVELVNWVDNLADFGNGDSEGIASIIRERVELPDDKEEGIPTLPTDGTFVNVNLKGFYDGIVFETREPVEFFLGDGHLNDIVSGVEIALRCFRRGEKSILTMDHYFAYGQEGSEKLGIPPNSKLTYMVKLNFYHRIDEPEDKMVDRCLHVCSELNKIAGQLYELGNLERAMTKYRAVIIWLEDKPEGVGPKWDEDDEHCHEERMKLLFEAHLALGKGLMEIDEELNFKEALRTIDAALTIEPLSVEAWLFRGRMHLSPAIYDTNEALKGFLMALELKPDNPEIIAETDDCRRKLKAFKVNEAALAAKMLGLNIKK